MRLRLHSVDDIGEFDGLLNEEHGNIVSNDIPVALLSVKLDGKATNVTDGIRAASATLHS